MPPPSKKARSAAAAATSPMTSANGWGNDPLSEADPELFDLIEREKLRSVSGLELIASENFTSRAVFEANGSCLTNKYSEGLPGRRYYGGNEHVDSIERLCQQRALAAFRLNGDEWGVNVQSYSGSTANFSAFTALLEPHDRLMGLDLPAGGHLTHGFQVGHKKISSSSIYFDSMPYSIDDNGIIDYDNLERLALSFHPKLLLCGASAYPRDWDYARLRAIADKVGAYLLCDMAHYSGLVAAGEHHDPFEYCDVVTTTTHKTLRGPRGALIFFRKTVRGGGDEPAPTGLEDRVNSAVFPGCQGGPHNHCIAAVATALRQVATPEFRAYAQQVRANAATLARCLLASGYKLVSGGTDNHLVLWDLKPLGLTGSKMELLLEAANITVNKNTVVGDKSAMSPGGLRIGSAALTTRGFVERDFEHVAELLDRGVKIALELQKTTGKWLKDFRAALPDNAEVARLREDVERFASRFSMPGFDVSTMKYPPPGAK